MIDLKLFRENPNIYIKSAQYKNCKIDFDRFFVLDKKIKELKTQIEELN
jgi:seryl-tRNA synthetase